MRVSVISDNLNCEIARKSNHTLQKSLQCANYGRGQPSTTKVATSNLMCSTLPGDADEAVCARYCRPSSAHRHCAHCLCASCDFCSDGGTANRIPPLPTRVDHAASRATVDRLRSRFWSSSGVIMRVWECSLAGCAAHYKEATTRAFIKRCARRELETLRTLKRPASMLRWDVPAALYAGGRCVNPAASEDPLYPRVVLEDDARGLQDSHGWRRHGFSGHNVTQAA